MYRRETKEKAAYAGNRTRRTDSVKQHEMAALREMEQMVLAAENGLAADGRWQIWKAAESGTIPS